MSRQMIIWTACPNGIEGNKLKLSVFVSPRLTGNAQTTTLAEFPMFVNWPETLAKIGLAVRYGATTLQPTSRNPRVGSEVWTALFKPGTFVKSYAWKDYKDRRLQSYDVKNTVDFIKDRYTKIAAESPVQRPTEKALVSPEQLGLIGFHGGMEATGRDVNPEVRYFQAIDAQVRANKFMPRVVMRDAQGGLSPQAVKMNFAMVKRFFVRPDLQRIAAGQVRRRPPRPTPPRLDFHEQLSALGSYPQIMRLAGLVIDLELTLPAGTPPASTVQVVVTGDRAFNLESKAPLTAINAQTFLPATKAAAASDIRNGMMLLGDPRFDVVMFDVDGAALNLMDFTTNMQYRQERKMRQATETSLAALEDGLEACEAEQTPTRVQAARPVLSQKALLVTAARAEEEDRSGLPALRSAGLTVIKSRRAEYLSKTFLRATTLQSVLVSPVAAVPRAAGDDILYADDLKRGFAVDVWDGQTKKWRSLMRRIGTYEFLDAQGRKLGPITDEGFIETTAQTDPQSNEIYAHESIFRWTGWSLAVERPAKSLANDGSLSKLEEEKAENTNPAGLRMTATFKVPPGSLPRLRFGTAYRVRARVVDLAGNSVGFDSPLANAPGTATREVVYARHEPLASPNAVLCAPTKPGEAPHRLVIRSNYAGSATEKSYEPETQRYIVPAPASATMAEQHGKLDGAANMLADRAGNKTYTVLAENDRPLKDAIPAVPADAEQGGPPVIIPPGQLRDLPYLPDPIATGVFLRNLPSGANRLNGTINWDPGANWFDAKPFRIRMVEGSAAPSFDAESRVLTVSVPKAEQIDVLISSILDQNVLPALGLYQWLRERPQLAARLNDLTTLIRSGRHWMFTPEDTLTLVHAVQQPLEPPRFGQLAALKQRGNTYAVLTDPNLFVHGKSTARIDIAASWREPYDNVRAPAPEVRESGGHVCDFRIDAGQTNAILTERDNYRHEFHDTKHRRVTYTAAATTRFREYFADKPLQDEDFRRVSAPVTVNVLNSARPDAPQVLYVIPAFAWKEQRSGPNVSRVRSGGGLRVYMDRPWFSSGEGEQLAVVLPYGAVTPQTQPFVTLWGKDPIWLSNAARNAELTPADFPLKASSREIPTARDLTRLRVDAAKLPALTAVTAAKVTAIQKVNPELQRLDPKIVALLLPRYSLEELGNSQQHLVDIAPHAVGFDEERKLWYSDIEIQMPEAYQPFVRLALARYQANSLPDCHLSRVVKVDFIQLTPERTVSIAQASGATANDRTLFVTVTGVSYQPTPGKDRAIMRVVIEQKLGDGSRNLGWAPIPGNPVDLEYKRTVGGRSEWQSLVILPGERSNYRIVIQEFEQHPGGENPARPTPEGRLVFADAVEL